MACRVGMAHKDRHYDSGIIIGSAGLGEELTLKVTERKGEII